MNLHPAKTNGLPVGTAGTPGRFGYNEVFDQWAVTDVQDMVLRDRNHPCIIMWSIGNEIDYANDPFSHPVLGKEYKPENPSAEKMVQMRQTAYRCGEKVRFFATRDCGIG